MKEILGNASHFIKYFPASLNLLSAKSDINTLSIPKKIAKMAFLNRDFKDKLKTNSSPKIRYWPHHMCHAASAYYINPYEHTAILVIDGRGEDIATSIWEGKDGKLEMKLAVKVPHSIGHLYAACTDFLGFKPFADEWKVMGLSAYGNKTLFQKFTSILNTDIDPYQLNLEFFNFHTHGQSRWVSEKFIAEFGSPRQHGSEITQRDYNLAMALQVSIEDIGIKLSRMAQKLTTAPNLLVTGGVGLNCLMNQKIKEDDHFKNYFFHPLSNDSGCALGAALLSRNLYQNKFNPILLENLYLGPEYLNDEIEKVLLEKKIVYKRHENFVPIVAEYLASGKVVGWFHGRLESGPRALGNRSIVASPLISDMKDRLNQKVKRRESFRPFAPSVKEESAAEYFEIDEHETGPYMIRTMNVREAKRSIIPAVTHVDGTARVQTVNRKQNLLYWNLINEFEKLTGVPIIINTSFNENEPIVNSPDEAISCFLRNNFDVLSIGSFIVEKKDNLT